jgi:hypothetical protein
VSSLPRCSLGYGGRQLAWSATRNPDGGRSAMLLDGRNAVIYGGGAIGGAVTD